MFDADRWRVLEPLLDRALELSAGERPAWLEELRQRSPGAAEELTQLLSHEAAADGESFLLTPPDRPGEATLIGRRLGDQYEIERELGAGGMATVYLARDLRHHRQVAVKVLRAELSAALGSERFRREIELTAALQHPHILPLFDSGSADGHLYYVMPFVEGETLRARLTRERPMAVDEAVRLAIAVADALAYAHARGVVHRDVKPENILLQDGHALVSDFGIALALERAGDERVTRPGISIGTPLYMAPEQVMDRGVDARADVYALGVVLYEMLAGDPPFAGTSAKAVLAQVLMNDPAPLSVARPEAPPHVAAAVRKALAREPDDRFATASGFASALRSSASGEAVVNQPGTSTVRRARRGRFIWVASLASLAAVALAGIAIGFDAGRIRERFSGTAPASSPPSRSLAVLPFENVGGAPADEYFSDGLTEELIAALSQVRSLRVAARTSSFAFKRQSRDIRDIARALGVGSVLVGSVRARDGRIRVTAQLIDASNGLDLWSNVYDERKLSDVIAIQSDLALRIARALEANLSPVEADRIARKPTESIDAYTLYLKGRFAWARFDQNLTTAIDYFQRAIAIDSQYARAWAGLANAYTPLGVHGYVDPRQVRERAHEAALRAVSLDPDLAEAHTALAGYLHVYAMDFPGAMREYQRAIALDPNDAIIHSWYGLLLEHLGRFDEAIAERRLSVQLDPLAANTALAAALRHARRTEESRAEYRTVIERHPDFWQAQDGEARLLETTGEYPEAIHAMERAVALAGRTLEPSAGLARLLALSGRRAEALRLIADVRAQSSRSGIYHPALAGALVAVGDTNAAMQWLEKSYEQRNPGLVEIYVDARYDGLRRDPRFQDLLRRIGFVR